MNTPPGSRRGVHFHLFINGFSIPTGFRANRSYDGFGIYNFAGFYFIQSFFQRYFKGDYIFPFVTVPPDFLSLDDSLETSE